MTRKEDEVWGKVFEILEWSGKHIIPFAGCQALAKNVKEFVSAGTERGEALKVLKEENNELKREKRILEQEVVSLKTRLEEGKNVEGRLKRKLEAGKEVKRKLLKFAESFRNSETDEESEGKNDYINHQEGESAAALSLSESHPQERIIRKHKKSKTPNRKVKLKSGRHTPPPPEQARDREILHFSRSQSHRSPLASKNRTVVKDADFDSGVSSAVEPTTTGKNFGRVSGAGQLIPTVTAHGSNELGLVSPSQNQLAEELETFFKSITEDPLCSDPAKRFYAFARLMDDPRVKEVVPNLVAFIVNILENESSLTALRRLFKMVRNVMQNPNVMWEQHLTTITPCIAKFAIAKISDQDDRWGLRDSAAKLLGKTFKRHGNNCINSQLRTALKFVIGNQDTSLESMYGAIAALGELGEEVIKCDLIPEVGGVGDRIKLCLNLRDPSEADRVAAEKLQDLIVRVASPIVMSTQSSPDRLKVYNQQFSYFGESLQKQVIQLRRRERYYRRTLNTSRYSLREQKEWSCLK